MKTLFNILRILILTIGCFIAFIVPNYIAGIFILSSALTTYLFLTGLKYKREKVS